MTISNFVAGPISGADSDGIAIYCHGANYIPCVQGTSNHYLSFQMAFDKNVRLLSYDVSYQDDTADSTTTYSQGALSSVQANGVLGLTQFVNQFIATSNQPIFVSSTDPNRGLLQIKKLTVEEVSTPPAVPGPLPLVGASIAFGMGLRLRKRIKLAS